MIRNRISAQNSRDRKKVYVESLEKETEDAINENLLLKEQIEELKKEN